MNAKQFFEDETIPETNYEKIPEGMTFIKTKTLDIEKTEADFGKGKTIRYKLNFKNKKNEDEEYEVGVKIIKGIEKAILKETEYIVITRQGLKRDDTNYAVSALEE